MLASIKILTPYLIYLAGFILILTCLIGRPKYTLALVVFLMPLRNVINKIQSLPMGKDFIDILLVAMVIGTLVSTLRNKERLFAKSPLNGLCIGLIIYTYFSLWNGFFYLEYFTPFDFGDPRVQSWKNFCILPILYLLTVNNIKDKKSVWMMVGVMCASMFLMDYYLTRQLKWHSAIVSRTKIEGTFVFLGPNEIAAFYNQYTLLLMSLFFFMKRGIKKIVLLWLIIINLNCVLFLFSRAAYLATAAGMFFLFAIKKKKLLIPLILAGILWQVVLPATVQERIMMTTNEYGQLDVSSETRLIVWRQSVQAFKDNPLLGVGYAVFKDLDFALGDAHNIYLRILAEQGIVGMAIFLMVIGAFIQQGWKLYTTGEDNISRGLGLGLVSCIIVLIVNNMFGNRWTYLQVSSFLWVFAGLVTRLNIIASKQETINQKPLIKRMRLRTMRKENPLPGISSDGTIKRKLANP